MKSTEAETVRKIDLTSDKDVITTDHAAVEIPVAIYVNAEPVATLFATPPSRLELAIGYPIVEGMLRSYSDIGDVSLSPREGK